MVFRRILINFVELSKDIVINTIFNDKQFPLNCYNYFILVNN